MRLQEGAAYFQRPVWLPCTELVANIHLQLGGSAGAGMFPNKISKSQWVWQSVCCLVYLHRNRRLWKKKWMGDISLCPVFFMLYQKRSAGRHHANLLWLPSWQMDFCRWQTIILPFDIREVARESLFDLKKKKDLRFDRIFFFSLCMVCNIMSGAERD